MDGSGHWENDLFIIGNKKYGVSLDLRTFQLMDVQELLENGIPAQQGQRDTLQQHLTDTLPILKKICDICGKLVPGKKSDRRYCSARCRQRASRKNRQLILC